MAVSNNREILEVQEAGNRNELTITYYNRVATRYSPSRLINRYRKILFRFPTTIEVTGVSAISDAIIGRC